jgi:hypothetical protein
MRKNRVSRAAKKPPAKKSRKKTAATGKKIAAVTVYVRGKGKPLPIVSP